MLHWVGHLIESYGYAIVVVLVLAEGVGLPLPGETALITAAAVAAQSHRLTIVGVIILMLSMLGEYVLRTLKQVTEIESYHVLEEIGGDA